MSWARTSNFTLMPNKTVCSSAVGRRKRTLPFCIPPRVRNLFRVVPQKVLTLQLVNSWGGGRTRPIGNPPNGQIRNSSTDDKLLQMAVTQILLAIYEVD